MFHLRVFTYYTTYEGCVCRSASQPQSLPRHRNTDQPAACHYFTSSFGMEMVELSRNSMCHTKSTDISVGRLRTVARDAVDARNTVQSVHASTRDWYNKWTLYYAPNIIKTRFSIHFSKWISECRGKHSCRAWARMLCLRASQIILHAFASGLKQFFNRNYVMAQLEKRNEKSAMRRVVFHVFFLLIWTDMGFFYWWCGNLSHITFTRIRSQAHITLASCGAYADADACRTSNSYISQVVVGPAPRHQPAHKYICIIFLSKQISAKLG